MDLHALYVFSPGPRCYHPPPNPMPRNDPWEPWLTDLERASADGDAARCGAILEDLWRFSFHQERARTHRQWDRLFATLVRLLDHGDARIVALALHYAR